MADSRLLLITSPLGPDALSATRLTVNEHLGLPYSIDVEVLSSDSSIKASALLTQNITVTVALTLSGQLIQRYFNGLVSEFERLGPAAAGTTAYRLVAVPGTWRLGLKRNCRIFENKTVQDIVTLVLGDHDQPAPTWGILPALQPLPYCTQFNETDLHFISRLLEEHGMTYYFSHAAGSHTLHVSATAPGFPAFVGGDVVAMQSSDDSFHLNDWRSANRARSAAVQFQDMDDERSQPSVVLTKNSDTRTYADEPAMWQAGKIYNWPGGMSTRPGVNSAAVAMGEIETASEEFAASASDPRFSAGVRATVSVRAEDRSEQAKQYVLTSVSHRASDTSALTAGAGATESYTASLSLAVASRTWMPAQRHARPVMAGLYSAKVTGPPGEKIHVDEFGRIKVKFRWDRLGADDDTSSIWVRVAQAAAGAWGGTWFLPRVGDEVLVAFLDADPDRPLVTGSVYGKDAKPPFQPGVNRSQSGIRTRSYKSDSADDANILRFEDKKDSEEVLLHAQKDLTVEVENDETHTIKHNRTVTIETGNDVTTVEMGDMTLKCSKGSIMIEALQKITLKVGSSTIVLDQAGVTTKGVVIKEEAEAMHQTKAPMVQEDASAMVIVKGAMVMIN